MRLNTLHIVVKFQTPIYIDCRDMNYFLVWIFVKSRQTESDAFEPTMQTAQVGSKKATVEMNPPVSFTVVPVYV